MQHVLRILKNWLPLAIVTAALGGLVYLAVQQVYRSLAPFLILYDPGGNELAASGQLHGQALPLPAGFLDAAKTSGENRVTLQPEPGVRIASVIIPAGSAGFVLAGRSLRESESRTDQMMAAVAAAEVVTLGASLITVIFFEFTVKS